MMFLLHPYDTGDFPHELATHAVGDWAGFWPVRRQNGAKTRRLRLEEAKLDQARLLRAG
ncbi:MAG: hypothetical protein ACOH1R_12440 [Luteimonas sp.]